MNVKYKNDTMITDGTPDRPRFPLRNGAHSMLWYFIYDLSESFAYACDSLKLIAVNIFDAGLHDLQWFNAKTNMTQVDRNTLVGTLNDYINAVKKDTKNERMQFALTKMSQYFSAAIDYYLVLIQIDSLFYGTVENKFHGSKNFSDLKTLLEKLVLVGNSFSEIQPLGDSAFVDADRVLTNFKHETYLDVHNILSCLQVSNEHEQQMLRTYIENNAAQLALSKRWTGAGFSGLGG